MCLQGWGSVEEYIFIEHQLLVTNQAFSSCLMRDPKVCAAFLGFLFWGMLKLCLEKTLFTDGFRVNFYSKIGNE